MRWFVAKLVFFLVTALLLYTGIYTCLFEFHHWSRTRNDPTAIYVLGDSRTVHGLDIERISATLGRPVHSHATHGASSYVFYVMAESVPAGATVLVDPTIGMLARRRDHVDYKSGLSLSAIKLFLEQGYDWWFYRRIIADNHYPFGAPHTTRNREGFPITDRPDLESNKRFRNIFLSKKHLPHYAKNRVVFERAIRILEEKKCKLSVVDFPVTDELRELREQSIYPSLSKELPFLSADPNLRFFDNVQLEASENIWYDMDHLNIRGRELMTDWVLEHVFGTSKS